MDFAQEKDSGLRVAMSAQSKANKDGYNGDWWNEQTVIADDEVSFC
eukprot:CAMPEP_0117055270 /NCGR_PEP_ID=MMETSP0472-20121206/38312_1 /TAXON_ID=693140 ORGANISM="Tiarina fusus, Strain LIS" /NCGR_SAMPLE_ID=MMETSP0472 /ASSEMBLY_ACC=CAM_ASM_000603 /LENGTH=45 /DNA_ID= /DNA_START= /DNA_END= /DNA_ORIENTATION=